MDYRIEKWAAGKTVLEIAKKEIRLSSALLRHLKFLENGILVNGAHVTVRYVLQEGDTLSLAVEDTCAPDDLLPVDLSLPIAFEDDDTVVPDKPPHMPTHPSHGHHEDTVANALAFRYANEPIPFVFRPINRLDRNTSGLLLITRNRMAAGRLSSAMKEGRIQKRYLAILCGKPPQTEGLIETYIRRTAQSIIVRENCAPGEGGDLARTQYAVLSATDTHSLVCAAPLTGRTHQLRVHFAGLGCPILGDDMYGTPSPLIDRHALHSCFLAFPRPSDGATQTVRSPLPADMRQAAEELGLPCPTQEELDSLLDLSPKGYQP